MHNIKITNFGPITHADVDVNRFTVIIGEHATGKSTIAKLVFFFRSLQEDLVNIARIPRTEINGQKVNNTIRDKFYLYFGSTRQLNPDYRIEYRYDIGKQLILKGSPLEPIFEAQPWFNEVVARIQASSVFIYRDRQNLNFDAAEREEERLRVALSRMFNDNTKPLFIPDGRNITVKFQGSIMELFSKNLVLPTMAKVDEEGNLKRNDAKKIDRYLLRDFIYRIEEIKEVFGSREFKDILLDNPNLRNLLNCIEGRLLKARYRNNQNGEYLLLDHGVRVSLENASSGQQESVRIAQDLALCIVDGDPVFRVIEEPEAHLFPTGQRAIIELLAATLNSTNEPSGDVVAPTNRRDRRGPQSNSNNGTSIGVFITTHSPYILTILNNLILAGDLEAEGRNSTAIPPIFRLNPDHLSAYMVNPSGVCTPINDTAQGVTENMTGLIGENILEGAFGDLQAQFDQLLELGA